MNELLEINVRQEPGVITWNFEDLKAMLQDEMDRYEAIVYDDESIKEAKNDLAGLRKLKDSVNERKKEIKEKCLEPYLVIETQAKELMAMIDRPIAKIKEKTDDYEARRRAAKKEKIVKAMKEAFSDLPAGVAKKLEFKTYDVRWENATSAEKNYRDGIAKAHQETVDALRIIENVDGDFKDDVYAAYIRNLDLTEAMMKAQELQKQKERFIEAERRRAEAERLRAEAEKARQERIAAEKKKQEEAPPVAPAAQSVRCENAEDIAARDALEAVEETVKTVEGAVETVEEAAENGPKVRTIVFRGTDEQLKKVLGYIKFIGAEYRVR